MNRTFLACLLLFASTSLNAAVDHACQQDCRLQGGGQSYCARTCAMPEPGFSQSPGLMQQPGLPKNPAFEQMERQSKPDRYLPQGNPPTPEEACLLNCARTGTKATVCRQRCGIY